MENANVVRARHHARGDGQATSTSSAMFRRLPVLPSQMNSGNNMQFGQQLENW